LQIVLSVVLALNAAGAFAQQAQGGVFQAVCIFNFTKYITYPAARQSGDYVIAIVGKSDVQAQLERTAAVKRVATTNQAIKVVDYDQVSPSECHLVFVPEKFSKRLKNVADALRGKPIVLVTEGSGLYNQGSCISFVFNSDKKFEVNRTLIEAQGLKASSELLKVATIVP
jgi:hypothetical protein